MNLSISVPRDKDDTFGIYQPYPHVCIPCAGEQTIGEAQIKGLLTVVEHAGGRGIRGTFDSA